MTSTALSIGSGGTRALCRRPPAARRCDLVAVPHGLSLVSHPRSCIVRVVAPVREGSTIHTQLLAFFSTGTITCLAQCAICPCDRLTRAGVHAILVPSVLALIGNFPASNFPALRLLLALRPSLRPHAARTPTHAASRSTLCGHGVHATSLRELGSTLRGRL
ncbi:hypothetical protein B0H14DRAFT_1333890 [Mycena olivaceomarginata]|nr:hypothetical protein B0H14DRAFT_1333890 [Mycena olivaceomarginata]